MKVYVHLKFAHSEQEYQTYLHEIPQDKLDNDYTLNNFIQDAAKTRTDINLQYAQLLTNESAKPIKNLNMLFSNFFDQKSDVYIICDQPQPIAVGRVDEKKIYYETIKNFTFYESGEWSVKVLLDFPKIHQHNAKKISCRFLETSFELKVHEFNGKNYQFSAPRTMYSLDPEKSKIQIKENQIVILIRKAKKEDSWFTLFKVKCIGE
ncbi:hypothetical protein IMG5_195010 [Ichthyophthirius multifiliis]|uniref:CS domain-containing protein n=1 Tax=Ichthyophthirius multifiliis TaxID=5932 RepID=G0R4V4_ICHMU|nr:hypothetical protein IMG5_195010 [Ichthyophthirius multifiliis]EGR27497.1 hypothetical protein IMG5_195010 [Ichthyophthirius multifiliis]|eukprot:XP_004024407.1 hypothetical protein IMG5_195010 [Ichthyophthirius multifiliis]